MKSVIGTAGWSIARSEAAHFPAEGSALERYAAVFPAAEINSSFHRSHRASTWQRWGESVPEGFRFSAKLSKQVTHKHKLRDCGDLPRAAGAGGRGGGGGVGRVGAGVISIFRQAVEAGHAQAQAAGLRRPAARGGGGDDGARQQAGGD